MKEKDPDTLAREADDELDAWERELDALLPSAEAPPITQLGADDELEASFSVREAGVLPSTRSPARVLREPASDYPIGSSARSDDSKEWIAPGDPLAASSTPIAKLPAHVLASLREGDPNLDVDALLDEVVFAGGPPLPPDAATVESATQITGPHPTHRRDGERSDANAERATPLVAAGSFTDEEWLRPSPSELPTPVPAREPSPTDDEGAREDERAEAWHDESGTTNDLEPPRGGGRVEDPTRELLSPRRKGEPAGSPPDVLRPPPPPKLSAWERGEVDDAWERELERGVLFGDGPTGDVDVSEIHTVDDDALSLDDLGRAATTGVTDADDTVEGDDSYEAVEADDPVEGDDPYESVEADDPHETAEVDGLHPEDASIEIVADEDDDARLRSADAAAKAAEASPAAPRAPRPPAPPVLTVGATRDVAPEKMPAVRGASPAPAEQATAERGASPTPAEQATVERGASLAKGSSAGRAPGPVTAAPGTVNVAPGTRDRGAEAAARTVRQRKKREERLAFVGPGADVLRARRGLLLELAAGTTGARRARLLVAAAELAEQVGDRAGADAAYRDALETDSANVVALRAVRRRAVAEGDLVEAAQLFALEAESDLDARELASLATTLGELALIHLDDAPAALGSARRALDVHPGSFVATLLAQEAAGAFDREPPGDVDRGVLVRLANDGGAVVGSALFVVAARSFERSGLREEALALYREASRPVADGHARTADVHADPTRVSAALGWLRLGADLGHDRDVAAAFAALGEALESPPLAEAARRQAARLHARSGDVAGALSILAFERDPLAIALRARLAAVIGDRDERRAALEARAAATAGVERGIALAELAEARSAEGDMSGAEDALRASLSVAPELSLARMVRELILRAPRDASREARMFEDDEHEPGRALARAAKLARSPAAAAEEAEWLSRAEHDGVTPVTVEVLSVDVAASQQDVRALDALWTREIERRPRDRRAGAALALAAVLDGAARSEDASRVLRARLAADEADPLVLAALAHRVPRVEGAALLMRLASHFRGERAAAAMREAARLQMWEDVDATATLERALAAAPDHLPTWLALEANARARHDDAGCRRAHEHLAELVDEPTLRVGHLVRAAFATHPSEVEGATAFLERAHHERPDDSLVAELMLRLVEPGVGAHLLDAIAERTGPDAVRLAYLRAAFAHELSGAPAAAAERLRRTLGGEPPDAIVLHALDRTETLAGEASRVGERRFNAVKEAPSDEARIAALEALADFDLEERADSASAVLSHASILESRPDHVPSLRALERAFAESGRPDDLVEIDVRWIEAVSDASAGAAHARVALRARRKLNPERLDMADESVLLAERHADGDLWLAQRVLAARLAEGDARQVAAAALRVAALCDTPSERCSATLMAALAIEASSGPVEAAEALSPAIVDAADHPVAAEELGRLYELAEEPALARDAYARAARATHLPRRAAELYHRAAVLSQDSLRDEASALEALLLAADADVGYLDVYERARGLLAKRGDIRSLADLTRQRIEAGAPPATLVELHELHARLRDELGMRDLARDALRAALAIAPERIDALRRLAEISLEDEDHRSAAEALIRIAKLRRDRDELRWVFFTLGDIYDVHMPDPKRADAAFQRVLKLVPDDREALERLATLHTREGDLDKAVQVIRHLARLEQDPAKGKALALRLSHTLERMNEARDAEQALEVIRRKDPLDLEILHALAAFYQRQNAQSALSVHLNRAAADFRARLEIEPGDVRALRGLVDVLSFRPRPDAARAAASTAAAVAVVDVQLGKLVDEHGGVPGAANAALDPDLDDLLSPAALTPAVRGVLRLAGPVFEKVLDVDLRSLRPERLSSGETPLRRALETVAGWIGEREIAVFVTRVAPRVCVPLPDGAVLVGSELLGLVDDAEQRFLLARAMKIHRAGLGVAVRAQPTELARVLVALVHAHEAPYVPPGFDARELAQLAKRVGKAIPRKLRDTLGPLAIEMGGDPEFDPAYLGLRVSELGDRAALVAEGSVPAAITALLKLAGQGATSADGVATRVANVRRVPEALALLAFAVSEAHFEARRRTGAERR